MAVVAPESSVQKHAEEDASISRGPCASTVSSCFMCVLPLILFVLLLTLDKSPDTTWRLGATLAVVIVTATVAVLTAHWSLASR